MPNIQSSFKPPAVLRNGHLQTILPVFLPRRLAAVYQRERLELSDGDFLDLDWARADRGRLAILSHGLEGSSDNDYMKGMAAALNATGWDALAWNFRGCSAEPNRLLRFYHSGETGDLRTVIEHASQQYQNIALVGFSLGGNVTLKYLGEGDPHPAVTRAVTISTPVDLQSSAHALDQRWSNGIYLRRFMKTLTAKVKAKTVRWGDALDINGICNVTTFEEFDDRYTARLHGFRDALDYWTKSSSRQFLDGINVPTLLLNARDDPFLTEKSFPFAEAERNPALYFESPESGGHVGFLDFARGWRRWLEPRVVEFLGG